MSVSDSTDPDGPLFEWYINNYHRGNSPETVENAKKAKRRFNDFLRQEDVCPQEIDRKLAYKFISTVVEDCSAHYQRGIVGEIQRFYDYCLNRGVEDINGNPIKVVLEDQDPLDDPDSRDPHMISVDEMGQYIRSFSHPTFFTVILGLAKTTRRVGAFINLDLYDLNIDHPACDWEVHPDIRHNTDYLYIPREPTEGEKFRGETRSVGNKTESSRIVPIDNELKNAFIWNLSVRPGSYDPYSPIFKDSFGDRIGYGTLYNRIRDRSEELGHWYGPNDPHNIGLHYFRHWSTTTLRDRSNGDTGLVDYIRGDKGQDMKDRYTHWSDAKEREYLDIVPKFFD